MAEFGFPLTRAALERLIDTVREVGLGVIEEITGAANARASDPTEDVRTERIEREQREGRRCPTCASPDPKRHPAMQFEGEVQPCSDPWHWPETHVFEGDPTGGVKRRSKVVYEGDAVKAAREERKRELRQFDLDAVEPYPGPFVTGLRVQSEPALTVGEQAFVLSLVEYLDERIHVQAPYAYGTAGIDGQANVLRRMLSEAVAETTKDFVIFTRDQYDLLTGRRSEGT